MYDIGITASQNGLSENQRWKARNYLSGPDIGWIRHGDCIGGDEECHIITIAVRPTGPRGYPESHRIAIYPGMNQYGKSPKRAYCQDADEMHDPAPYMDRNFTIVTKSGLLLAFPSGEEKSQPRSGTWATVRIARDCKIPRIIVRPTGEVKLEGFAR